MMGRGRPLSSSHHALCAYYFFIILFLLEYPRRAQGRGWGFLAATMNVAPATFIGKYKKNRKENPTCLISRLLVVFTRQLEILVTALERLSRGESKVRKTWGFRGSNQYTLREKGKKVLAPTMLFITLRTHGGSLLPQWALAFHLQLVTWFQAKSLKGMSSEAVREMGQKHVFLHLFSISPIKLPATQASCIICLHFVASVHC